MTTILFIFWISLTVLFFCYAGYGILLFIHNRIKFFLTGDYKDENAEYIPVTLIIAAYNEREVLEEKLRNTLEIDYPLDKFRVILITDGSADGSDELIAQYPSILLLHQEERRGKLAAIQRAMQFVETPVVVFSDANSLLNKECVKRIVKHYKDPNTGGVAGEKKIEQRLVSAVGEAEGLYWKYESFMKRQDAAFYSVVGAAGELFSIRTELFQPLDNTYILDDFLISMQVCLQGYRIGYEPGAYAIESASLSLAEEEKRKIRIAAGAYQSVGFLWSNFNIFKFPALGFQYMTRRLFRWVLSPILLVVLFFTNLLLLNLNRGEGFYEIVFYIQLFFYLLAVPGWLLVRNGRRAGMLSIPFYFLFMNYCLLKGLFRFLNRKQTVLWEKSLRQAVAKS